MADDNLDNLEMHHIACHRVHNIKNISYKHTLESGSLISTCMPKPGVDGRKEPACLSHNCVLYFPKKTCSVYQCLQREIMTKL